MSRIDELDDAQRAALETTRARWESIATATGGCDRDRVERGVDELYTLAGRPAAPRKLWFGSPMAGALAAAHIDERSAWADTAGVVRDRMRVRIGVSVACAVWSRICEALSAPIADRIGQTVSFLQSQFLLGVSGDITASMRTAVEEAVPGARFPDDAALQSTLARLGPFIHRIGCGLHDAEWLCACDYAETVLHLPLKGLDAFRATTDAGWWWGFERTVILTERPLDVRLDESHRPHAERSPAVSFSDGYAVWAWHGMRATSQVILGKFHLRDIDAERNAEIRRVMVERYGMGRYLEDSGAQLVDRDDCGELYRKEMEGDEPLVMVKVTNSTPEPDGSHKVYFLRVPPDMKTAREAVAWTFNVPGNEYRPEKET